ncbi:MAG TPA: c-type cytochrome [Planctomycetota bacterium]|nr:c-type cytochrome [Planctomycetota bacterium]
MKTLRCIAALSLVPALFLSASAFAGGDHAGEVQNTPDWIKKLPPAPPLSPEEALKTFKLQSGFHIELVAADPLVHDPIALAFDPDGRIYVVEYEAYMPNPEGKGEDQAICTIALLEDTKGTGKMDKRTVFLDKLRLPRAINLSNGGVLVAEPPHLLFCKDRGGTGVADVRGTIPKITYATQAIPEHTANGLMQGIDNWIYNANSNARFRWRNNHLVSDDFPQAGQWGITQDDWGRIYFNSNSNLLFADFVPPHYIFRNSAYSLANKNDMNALGINVEIVKDQRVYSSRANPGVNRGYQANALRPDGRLDKVTATCAPCVYRGDQFPPEYKTNVFICEPAGNLVKRELISESGITLAGKPAYDKDEFVTSTDERFRPVNLYTGPDGALYIVDMYRGIIQHQIYLTTFLKNQSIARGLDKYNGLGRIYRVVADGKKPDPKPHMSTETPAELVKHLSHPNGWWRDTAQRLLIEHNDESIVPELRKIASSPEPEGSFGRLHALWTLEGMNALDTPTVIAALKDPRPKLQAHALRVAETILKPPPMEPGQTQPKPFKPPQDVLAEIKALAAKNTDEGVRLQLIFTMGEVDDPIAVQIVDDILKDHIDNAAVRGAAISGMGGRELEFLEKVFANPSWATASAGKEKFVQVLAGCVMKRRIGERVAKLIDLAGAQKESWKQDKALVGMVENGPKNGVRVKLPAESAALSALLRSSDKAVATAAKKLDDLVKWPNRAGLPPEPPPPQGEHLASFERGQEVYKLCAECHHPQGWGIVGKAPPLAGSDWAQGTEQRTIRMILQGMAGPKTLFTGEIFNKNGELEMPAMGGTLTDQQVADVLTYIRREWDNFAPQVMPATVAEIRAKEKSHDGPWTEKELNAAAGVKDTPPPKDPKKKPN